MSHPFIGLLRTKAIGGRPQQITAISPTPETPTMWEPSRTTDWSTTANAMTGGGFVFLTGVDTDGIATGLPIPNSPAVTDGDDIGFWPNGLDPTQGLTPRDGYEPNYDSLEDAVKFVQPSGLGQALFFPAEVLATKWHLLLCFKSTDTSNTTAQCVFQVPAVRVFTNKGSTYALQTQVIPPGGSETNHIIRPGVTDGWTMLELRRDGSRLQYRTELDSWTEVAVSGWSDWVPQGDAVADPNKSMLGRASYTDGNFPDYVSWAGLINGCVLALDVWLENTAAQAARRLVTRDQPFGDLDPADPSPPDPGGDEPGSTGTATAVVNNYAELTSAASAASAGTIIQLNNGTYSGSRITVSQSATAENPIVIRAANLLGANVPNGFNLVGENIVVRGIEFRTGGQLNLPILLGGTDNQVWRCSFAFLGGDSVRFVSGSGGRLMYCEFYSLEPNNHYQPSTEVVRGNWTSDTAHFNLEIGYCFFRDMPAKPPGEPYGFRVRMALSQGGAGNGGRRFVRTNAWIHHCRMQDTGSCRCAMYNSGNTIEYVTITGQSPSGSPVSLDFNNRFGADNIWRGCLAIGTKNGFIIHGGPNKFIGCRIINGGSAQVFAGNISHTEPTDDAYPRAYQVKISSCDFPLIVGQTWTTSPPMTLDARDTRIEAHVGSKTFAFESGTVDTSELTETPVTPIEITESMVGPNGTGLIDDGDNEVLGTTSYPAAQSTSTVSDMTEMQAAANAAGPGTHIVLDADTSGDITISANGTATNPIIIRSDTPWRTIDGKINITGGSHIWVWGLRFTGAQGHSVRVTGDDHKIINCQFDQIGTSGSELRCNMIWSLGTDRLEIGWCDFTSPVQFAPWGGGQWNQWRFGFRGDEESGSRTYDLDFHHCWFYDFPATSEGSGSSDYRAAQSDAIELAPVGTTESQRNTVRYCLIEDIRSVHGSIIDVKDGEDFVVEYCTLLDCAGRLSFRTVNKATARHLWFENCDQGQAVFGSDHRLIDLYFTGTGARRIELYNGDLAYGASPATAQRPPCDDVVIQCCPTANIVIGARYSYPNKPRNTVVRGSYASLNDQGVNTQLAPSYSCSPTLATKLERFEVGTAGLANL